MDATGSSFSAGGGEVRVSVVVAAYNAAAFISRAIDSVRAQSLPAWEIVVADDCSTDATCEVVERFAAADPRVRLLRATANGGPSRARNRAIEAARGEWIAVLDADDAWRPQRLETLLALAQAEDADLVADNLVFYDDHAAAEVGVAFAPQSAPKVLTAALVVASERPWPTFRFGFLKPMVRSAALRRSGVRYDETIRFAEDFLFLTELLFRGCRGALCAEPMYVYTMQHNSAAGRKSATSRSTYDPRQRLRIAEHLQAAYGGAAGPSDAAILARFVDWMGDLCTGYEAVNGLRSGQPGALGRLARTPARALATYLVTTPTWKRAMHALAALRRFGRRPAASTPRIM